MSKYSSARYYQKIKKGLKKACGRYQDLSRKEKEKKETTWAGTI